MATEKLIDFDGIEGDWRDSGEGGQFVMLVVPEADDWSTKCHVDVGIRLTRPDVCNTPNDLWAPFNHESNAHRHDLGHYLFNRANDARAVIQDASARPAWAKEFYRGFQYAEWARWAVRAHAEEELSTGVLAAVHLGSSQFSLWSESRGSYWTAGEGNLTLAGRDLFNSLANAFDVAPLLLTFLDT